MLLHTMTRICRAFILLAKESCIRIKRYVHNICIDKLAINWYPEDCRIKYLVHKTYIKQAENFLHLLDRAAALWINCSKVSRPCSSSPSIKVSAYQEKMTSLKYKYKLYSKSILLHWIHLCLRCKTRNKQCINIAYTLFHEWR